MGCIGFSSSSSISAAATPLCNTAPNPNPWRFKVLEIEHIGGNTIILAEYPDCPTFNGHKLILLEGAHYTFTKLDPHFLEGDHPSSLGSYLMSLVMKWLASAHKHINT